MKNLNGVPTYYSKDSEVVNSQLATGCLVYGKVKQSIFSRGAVVRENAVVSDSIIMAKTEIKKDARVEYAIIDKNVIIEEGVQVIGTKEKPIVVEKNAHIMEDLIQTEG